jgi:peptide/nickel transport system substrate-binding protein
VTGARVVAAVAVLALVVIAPASPRTGRYGGTLVVGVNQDPGSLDPTVSNTSVAAGIDLAMCLSLYDFEQNHGVDEYVPVLAAAPPQHSPDKLSYTVKLKRGILFNDGTPLNAQAVVASVQRLMTYPGSLRTDNYASVASVSAAGAYTVVYHMKQRDSAFIGNASVFSPAALAGEGANFSADPVCAGPFMFDHAVAGDSVTLVKSPYWHKRAAIHLDKIVYKVISDSSAAEAALEAGDIQVLNTVAPSVLPAIQEKPGFRVLEQGVLGWQGVYINIGNRNGVGNLPYQNVGTPLASSAKLRQAFEEAINRTLLNKVVFSSLDVPSCTPVSPANTEWYPSIKVPCTPYDPADARKLVAASGYSNPTVHLLAQSAVTPQFEAQFIQSEEAAVGINVVIETTDNATTLARRAAGTFDACLGGRQPGSPDPHQMTYPFFETAGDLNVSGYSNPRMDYVLTHGLEATNPKARAVYYQVAMQIIHDDRPVIVLYAPTFISAFSAVVSGVERTASGFVSVVNAQFN